MSADRRERVVVRWLRHRIEAALPRDEIEPRQPCLGREVLVGLVVRLGGGEEQGVVRRGLRVVRLGRFVGGGAAAEGGEDEEGQRDVGEDESGARGAEERRADETKGVRVFRATPETPTHRHAWDVRVRVRGELKSAEPGPPQCAMGHGAPSLVFLRPGTLTQGVCSRSGGRAP